MRKLLLEKAELLELAEKLTPCPICDEPATIMKYRNKEVIGDLNFLVMEDEWDDVKDNSYMICCHDMINCTDWPRTNWYDSLDQAVFAWKLGNVHSD